MVIPTAVDFAKNARRALLITAFALAAISQAIASENEPDPPSTTIEPIDPPPPESAPPAPAPTGDAAEQSPTSEDADAAESAPKADAEPADATPVEDPAPERSADTDDAAGTLKPTDSSATGEILPLPSTESSASPASFELLDAKVAAGTVQRVSWYPPDSFGGSLSRPRCWWRTAASRAPRCA